MSGILILSFRFYTVLSGDALIHDKMCSMLQEWHDQVNIEAQFRDFFMLK